VLGNDMSQILFIFMSVSSLMILIKNLNFFFKKKKKNGCHGDHFFSFCSKFAFSNLRKAIFLNIYEPIFMVFYKTNCMILDTF